MDLPLSLELRLDGNRITALQNDDFKGCTELQTLNVRRNRLSDIQSEVFKDVSLIELHLNDNKLILNTSKSVAFFRLFTTS